GVGEGVPEERHPDFYGLQRRVRKERREGHHRGVKRQGRKGANATGGKAAAGRRPQSDDRELRLGEIEGQGGAWVRARWGLHGNGGEGPIRHWRYCCGVAATRARGDDGGDRRGYAH